MEKTVASPVPAVPAVFQFENHKLRTIEIDGEPWFVARDVAEAIGVVWKGTHTISHIPEEWRGVSSDGTPSGKQEVIVISEAGLFFFLNRSDKPAALPLQKKVAGEILPSIRKHGHYGQPVALPADPMQILKLTFDALTQVNSRVDEVRETVTRLLDTVRLQQWQCYELKAAVTQKAQEFRDTYNCTYSLLFPAIWGFVKKHFRVATYSAIPTVRFDEALALVRALTFGDMPDYVRESAGGVK